MNCCSDRFIFSSFTYWPHMANAKTLTTYIQWTHSSTRPLIHPSTHPPIHSPTHAPGIHKYNIAKFKTLRQWWLLCHTSHLTMRGCKEWQISTWPLTRVKQIRWHNHTTTHWPHWPIRVACAQSFNAVVCITERWITGVQCQQLRPL